MNKKSAKGFHLRTDLLSSIPHSKTLKKCLILWHFSAAVSPQRQGQNTVVPEQFDKVKKFIGISFELVKESILFHCGHGRRRVFFTLVGIAWVLKKSSIRIQRGPL